MVDLPAYQYHRLFDLKKEQQVELQDTCDKAGFVFGAFECFEGETHFCGNSE